MKKSQLLHSREAQLIRDLSTALTMMVDRFLDDDDKGDLEDFEYPLGRYVADAIQKASAYAIAPKEPKA